jgi:hypothetical protein
MLSNSHCTGSREQLFSRPLSRAYYYVNPIRSEFPRKFEKSPVLSREVLTRIISQLCGGGVIRPFLYGCVKSPLLLVDIAGSVGMAKSESVLRRIHTSNDTIRGHFSFLLQYVVLVAFFSSSFPFVWLSYYNKFFASSTDIIDVKGHCSLRFR